MSLPMHQEPTYQKKKKKVYITGAYFCCKAFREAMVQEQEKDKLKSEASL